MMAPGWDSPADPSMLRPVGPQAELVADLWWIFIGVCGLVYMLVIVAMLMSVVRRRHATQNVPDPRPAPPSERPIIRNVTIATALTVVTLIGLLVLSSRTGQALIHQREKPGLVVNVTGQQWWWRIEYQGKVPSENVVTANELHVPVGKPIKLILTSRDVIHSFWVPELAGKRDLIPGRHAELTLLAKRAGIYRGQCAEFCGHQHAHMGFLVIAKPEAEFERWRRAQRAPAVMPSNALQARGQQVFLSASCPLCHSIMGTDASGSTGPDLTHLASRITLASATLPNTRGHLAAWILDPQAIKTGNRMPPNALEPSDLEALLTYLESLK